MRIDGFQNISAVLQSLSAEKTIKSSKQVQEQTSTVSLSSFAETLQALQRESSRTTQARSERVEQLTQQVQSGQYQVDLNKTAQGLINANVINLKG